MTKLLIEAGSVDELHHEIRHVAVDPGLEQLDQSGMGEASKRLGFLSEALSVFAVWRADDLDRHVGAVYFVDGSKDIRHSTATEQCTQSVPPVQEFSGRTHLVNAEPSMGHRVRNDFTTRQSKSRNLTENAGTSLIKATWECTELITPIYRMTLN